MRRASSRMAPRISSSVTVSPAPALSRRALRALAQFRGDPTAMLSARVTAVPGKTREAPSRRARTMGAAPSAWTPTRWGIFSMNPSSFRSRKPLYRPLRQHPSPRAMNTRSGTSQASCSAISRAQLFFPSTRKGLMAQFRLYHPKRSMAAVARSKAAV
ncbi:MAG: hypothetical protein BWY88_00085 [Synergistetes bacterium ADurb.Bin520]|nr:MAG: hypothetical protein BWY88_00085 [Synergistetes bacterium ADurb.Bin520]